MCYIKVVSKLLKKTCAAFNDSPQMNVEQEGTRLRVAVRLQSGELGGGDKDHRVHPPVGGDSSAHTSLNLPPHTCSVGARRQP